MSHPAITVGHAIVTKEIDYSIPQEFAGASATLRIPAGRYPVEICRDDYGRPYAGVRLSGTLVRTTWHGTNTRVTEPNTPETSFFHRYLYEVVAWARGRLCITLGGAELALAEGMTVEQIETLGRGAI